MADRKILKTCITKNTLLFIALLIIFILQITIPSKLFACGPYPLNPRFHDTLSFIEHQIVGDPLWNKFYLKHSPGYGLYTETSMYEDKKYENIKEWQEYFTGAFNIAYTYDEIVNLIYLSELKDINNGINNIDINNLTPEIRILVEKKAFNTLEYIAFIKEVNPVISNYNHRNYYWGSWEPEYEENTIALMNSLYIKAVKKVGSNTLHNFLSFKYGYQIVRLAVLQNHYEKALEDYNNYIGSKNIHSYTRYKALGYKARALYKTGDYIEALKLYLDIFDQSPSCMNEALSSIRFMNLYPDDWNTLQKELTNNHKKTTAYFVQGLLEERDYSADILRKMIQTGPGQTKTEALLLIQIQRIEKDFMVFDHIHFLAGPDKINTELFPGTEYYYGNNKFNESIIIKNLSDTNRYSDLIEACETAGKRSEIRQPALWFAMGAYLALLEGNTEKAEELILKAEMYNGIKPVLQNQIHLIRTLTILQKHPEQIIESSEIRLIKDLSWAYTLNEYENNNGIYHSILILAAQKYLVKNDLPRAVLAFICAEGIYSLYKDTNWWYDNYINSISIVNYLLDIAFGNNDLEEMINILENPEKGLTPFLVSNANLYKEDIIFIQGIKALRLENFQEAQDYFNILPGSFYAKNNNTEHEYFDTYMPDFSEDSPLEETRKSRISMSLPKFAQYMETLKNQAAEALENAEMELYAQICFTMGNIYYNLENTPFPNISRRKLRSWDYTSFTKEHTYKDFWPLEYPLYIPELSLVLEKKYTDFIYQTDNFKRAENYYKKTMAASNSRELYAECCVLISMSRNIFLHNNIELNRNKMEYLYRLKNNYSDTNFYKQFITECPLLIMFE